MRAPISQCFSPPMNNQNFYLKIGPNGLNWQCCLAGSSKTAPRILIFSIAICADYSYEVKFSEIWAPAFFKHNNSFIATVSGQACFELLVTYTIVKLQAVYLNNSENLCGSNVRVELCFRCSKSACF